jgi:uncharacterized membrane protein YkvA (DUF1232 family)
MMRTLLLSVAVIATCYALLVAALYLGGRRMAAREIATLIPNLLRLFKALVQDPRVPRRSKTLLLFGAAWIASPIDLIPEFIPLLGPLDDAVVAALILRHLLRTAGPDVIAEHWRGEHSTLDRLLRVAGTKAESQDADAE